MPTSPGTQPEEPDTRVVDGTFDPGRSDVAAVTLSSRAEHRSEEMRRTGSTPPFRGPDGKVVDGSVAEVAYRRLGGVDQWVMMRGRNVANPPLVILHGGPGFSETALFRYFNAALEERFTVVYWDQRGAGKSYDRTIPVTSMTVEQFIADLDELVDLVRDRLHTPRVAILGHSWGSVLGVLYTARYPEKVAAYIGTGQIGDWPAAEAASYQHALAEAQRLGNRRARRRLRAIGSPPYDAEAVFTERTWSLRLAGGMRPAQVWKMAGAVIWSRESAIWEIPRGWRAFHASMSAMWPQVSQLNLVEMVPSLAVPVFFLLGRNDPWVRPETSEAYFNALVAPAKQLIWFDRSGHEPFVDEPASFNAAMTGPVRSILHPPARTGTGAVR